MSNFLQQASELEKILHELCQLEEVPMLSPFLDKAAFRQKYVQISEYRKAEDDLKAAVETFFKAVENVSVSDGGRKKELDTLKEKINNLDWRRREKLASN